MAVVGALKPISYLAWHGVMGRAEQFVSKMFAKWQPPGVRDTRCIIRAETQWRLRWARGCDAAYVF